MLLRIIRICTIPSKNLILNTDMLPSKNMATISGKFYI